MQRTGRALAAAEACLSAGAYEPALAMLAVAESSPLDELQRGRMELLHGMAAYAQRRGSDAPPLLLKAAKTLEALDPKLARDTYLDAWSAALFAGKLATAGSMYHISAEVLQAPPAAEPVRPADLLLDGLALILTDGRRAATPFLRRASTGFADPDAPAEEVLRWGWLATVGAVLVWDYDSCLAISSRTVRLARDMGALTVLAVALNILTEAVTMSGEFGWAERLIAEADAVTEATGTQVLPYGALYLRAFQGREEDVSRISDVTVREATAGGQGTAIEFTDHARAVVLNGLGRYREALRPAQDAADATPELAVAGWGLFELVEAAAKCGDTELARRGIERIEERNSVIETDWGYGILARSRALLATERRRRASSLRRSTGWAARRCVPMSLARTCCTASGCAARAAASTRASSSARPTTCWPRWAWTRSPSALSGSWSPPASGCGSAASRPSPPSPRRRPTSPSSRGTG